jgi:hypothetical protein
MAAASLLRWFFAAEAAPTTTWLVTVIWLVITVWLATMTWPPQ